MCAQKIVKTWSKTNVGNLVKHRSGGYYARLYVAGKERWKSLRTTVLEVAKARLRDQQRDAASLEPLARPAKSGRMTVAMAIERIMCDVRAQIPMRRRGRKSAITVSSAHYRSQTVDSLCKSWGEMIGSEFETLEIRKVTAGDVRRWADGYRARASATRFNNALGSLRRIFEIGIEAGELHRNPTQDVARSYKKPKATYTPTREEFARLVAAIRQSHSRIANGAADFVEFLAYTGARKQEAGRVTWGDVDFTRDRVTFRVTKNGQPRTNELIAEARELLQRMRRESTARNIKDRVFSVGEAYGSLRAAASAIGIPRISHHDLRDLFATTAIESGVDIPTVADWLGHQDGGALLLERYRKRRDDHARQSAKRVSFAPALPPANSATA